MFLPDRGNKDYRRGFDDALKLCRPILERGEKIMRAELAHREEAIERAAEELKSEKAGWEECKARYVLQQLKEIGGGI